MKNLALGLLIVGLGATGALAGDSEVKYGATLLTGFDSNPLKVSGDGPNGLFTQLGLDTSLRRTLRPGLALFVDGDARARFFESGVSDSDYGTGLLRAGVALSPSRFGRERLTIAAGGIYSLYRSTFVDRATGEVYEVDASPQTDPPTTVSIADRLDFDSAGLFLDARWNHGRRLSFFLDTLIERTDYVEDYDGSTDLDSLDYSTLRLTPGVDLRLNRRLRLVFSAALTDLDYDKRPALDGTGQAVPDSVRSYDYTQLHVTLRWIPADRWNVTFGLHGTDRSDTYASYYDYGSVSSFVALDRGLQGDARLRVYASLLDVDYDNATVSGANGEIRGNEIRSFVGRYERGLFDRVGLFVESGVQRTDSRDPVFAYDREWLLTGIEFRR